VKADDVLDRVARAAGAQSPAPLSAAKAHEMARTALLAASGRRVRARRWRASAAVLAIAAAVLLAFVLGRQSAPTIVRTRLAPAIVAGPSAMDLPSGDRVTTVAGARWAALRIDGERIMRLDEGEALFDVAPVPNSRFAVLTPDARIEVRGTVFAVHVEHARTRVRVFEGRVEVTHAGRTVVLEAGESMGSAAPWQLFALGEAARDRRAHTVRSPTPEPAHAPVPHAPLPPPSLEEARRALANGEHERVLSLVARSQRRGEWAMIEGDALRSLSRWPDAARAYDRAAQTSSPSPATQAGYLAARVRFEHLDDPAGALGSLDRSRADASHSPMEDAALALRVRILIALDRRADAREAARRHIATFPASPAHAWLTRIADETSE
jgi:hypothetical protein